MCLIVFAYRTVPGYSLILAANRDEFYERPTEPARFWQENPGMLAGKDLQAGGTWLGVHKNGRFAALTNYRNMGIYEKAARSRGFLVKEFLHERIPITDYFEKLKKSDSLYNGYNLLAGDARQLFHYSNVNRKITLLRPGTHGISNALMNTSWPKVEELKDRFQKLADEDELTERNLFRLFQSRKRYPAAMLPDTGLSGEMEAAVSAAFIQTPEYGTRSSTLLFIRETGEVHFTEKTYKPGTTISEAEKSYDFNTEDPNHG